MSLIKLAKKMITLPLSHLKGDRKELEKIRATAKKVEDTVDEMEADDQKAKHTYKISK